MGAAQDTMKEIDGFEKTLSNELRDSQTAKVNPMEDKPTSTDPEKAGNSNGKINYRAPDGSIIGKDDDGNTRILYHPPFGRG